VKRSVAIDGMKLAGRLRSGTGRFRGRMLVAIATGLACLVGLTGCLGSGSGDPASAEPGGTAQPVSHGAQELQDQLVKVVKGVSPAVVQIQTAQDLGSGVVFDNRGDVVTNAHVVDGATRFLVTLSSGGRHPANLAGIDRKHDLAVIRIAGAAPDPVSFADSSKVQVGDFCLAVGNPLGLRTTVTQGIVSSVDRKVSEGSGVTLAPAIQTSAAINPGNSGGALVDLSGRVIGIPTLAAVDPQIGGAAPGIGFAIPSNTVVRIAAGLTASGAN
jgi:S1-C subfamily serine protease